MFLNSLREGRVKKILATALKLRVSDAQKYDRGLRKLKKVAEASHFNLLGQPILVKSRCALRNVDLFAVSVVRLSKI